MTGRHSHLNKACLSALRRGTFFLEVACRSNLRLGDFSQKKARTLVRGLLGGWLLGFEPTTLGTTNRCSNQ